MEETENIQPDQSNQEVRPVRKQKRVRKSIRDILGGDVLSRESVIRNIPFLLYLSILALFYIGNTYYAEKTFNSIEKINNELKELRYQYITVKAGLMYLTKQTEIEKRAQGIGLKEPVLPPFRIYYTKNQIKNFKDTAAVTDERH